MSGREPGFYWVRELEGWRIGEWIAGRSPDGRLNKWRLHGCAFHEPDRAFEEIDERRIERVKHRAWRRERPGNSRPKT